MAHLLAGPLQACSGRRCRLIYSSRLRAWALSSPTATKMPRSCTCAPAPTQRCTERACAQVTHLFRDVFKGFGRILLSVCVSPGAVEAEDTLRVLRYAQTAAQLLTVPGAAAPARILKAVSPNITKPRKRPPPTPVPDRCGLLPS